MVLKYIYVNIYKNNEEIKIGTLEFSENIAYRRKILDAWTILQTTFNAGVSKGLIDSNISDITSLSNRLVLLIEGDIPDTILNTRRPIENDIEIELNYWKEQ